MKMITLLKRYQEDFFFSEPLSDSFQGFNSNAYPETAKGFYLERMGKELRIPREKNEGEEDYRKRILSALKGPDPEDEEDAA